MNGGSQEGERGRRKAEGYSAGPSAAAPRSMSIGCRRGHAESPIGQAVSVEGRLAPICPLVSRPGVGAKGSRMGR